MAAKRGNPKKAPKISTSDNPELGVTMDSGFTYRWDGSGPPKKQPGTLAAAMNVVWDYPGSLNELENPVTTSIWSVSPELANRANAGKVDYTLIPADASEAEALVWMHGQEKYGRGNWEKLWGEDTVNVVLASAFRHMMAIQKGEMVDPESGLPHAAHVRCNMAMLIRYQNQTDSVSSGS